MKPFNDTQKTVWVDAGKPDLGKLLPQKFTCSDKKRMENEDYLYHRNELPKQNLLLSEKKTRLPSQ